MDSGDVSLREAPYPGVAVLYFAVYLAYLFYSLESELWHWVGLVAVPVAIVPGHVGQVDHTLLVRERVDAATGQDGGRGDEEQQRRSETQDLQRGGD